MSGVFAIGLLIVSYLLTANRRQQNQVKRLNDQLRKSNLEIENLTEKVNKLINRYEREIN